MQVQTGERRAPSRCDELKRWMSEELERQRPVLDSGADIDTVTLIARFGNHRVAHGVFRTEATGKVPLPFEPRKG